MSSNTEWSNERRERLIPYVERTSFLSSEEKKRVIFSMLTADATAPVPRELRHAYAAVRLGLLAQLASALETSSRQQQEESTTDQV